MSARSGAPLRRADVWLRAVGNAAGQRRTFTDSSGAFAFTDVERGKYRLLVSRRGFIAQEYGARGPNLPGEILTLKAGEDSPRMTVRLSPLGAIAGRILDEDGEPIVDAAVQALQYTWSGDVGRLTVTRFATANDLGDYRLYGLSPGRYYVSAAYPSSEPPDPGGEKPQSANGYAPTYYPGTADPSGAVPVEVSLGSETLGLNFSVRRTLMFRLRGRVVIAGLNPQGDDARVLLMPRGSSGLAAALSKSATVQEPSGRFEIQSVAPGSYVIAAYLVGGARQYLARQTVEVSDSDVNDLFLEPSPGMDLHGHIRLEGKVVGESGGSVGGLSLFLRPRDPLPTGGFPARVASDKQFSFSGVAAGGYSLDISGLPQTYYLKSATAAGEDILSSGLLLAPGRSPGELELVLSASGGQLSGTVLDDRQEGVAEAQVLMVPDPSRRDRQYLFKIAAADSSGRFTITGIAPGEYKLYAWEYVDTATLFDPDFLKEFEPLGAAVRIDENGRESVQLRVISAGSGSDSLRR